MERKTAEEKLFNSQQRLQAALQAASAGTFRWNMLDDVVEMDRALRKLFGFPAELSHPTIDVILKAIHPDDRSDFVQVLEGCRHKGCDFHLEYRVVWPDGSIRWVDDRGKSFFDSNGRPEYMTGACVDITSRKASEQLIQESRQRLDLAIRAADLGIWFCDLPFETLSWDAKVKEHFWLPADAVVTIETFYARIHPQDREKTRQEINEALLSHQVYDVEYRTVSPAGETKWIRAIGRAFYNKAGQAIRFDGITIDISTLVIARESLAERRSELERIVNERTASLRQAMEKMQEFSYTVSHDLRGPLRAMRGFSQLLLSEHASGLDPEAKTFLEKIDRASARMEKLTHDVLTLTRLDRDDLQVRPVTLRSLLEDVITQYPTLQSSSVDLRIDVEHMVLAHEPSLAQALFNLLANAIKFVPENVKASVQVQSEQRDGRVRIWVRDNGIGIKPEMHERLFRMFERIHVNTNYEGTGIGLVIAKKSVERMGGAIGLESDGVSGCSFWIELPPA